ncbi:MAG: serine hydrolase domain-containing protein, partial [bacterium]
MSHSLHNPTIPGGQFTMAYNNRIIYSKGYGYADRLTLDSVNTESLFRIASCTKPFTSVGIMRLIQDHQLNLDDKVFGPTGILNQPQYQNILDSQVLEITIENLLEHTAGWDDNYQVDPMFYAVEIA